MDADDGQTMKQEPGPRDWEPSEEWKWGTPGSDDERRPLLPDSPELDRPPPPPAGAEAEGSVVAGVIALLLIVSCVGCGLGTLVRSWRGPASAVMVLGIGSAIGVLTYGASRPLRNAWPVLTASALARFAFFTVVALAALLGPAGAVVMLFDRGLTVPLGLAGAGLLAAAVFGLGTVAGRKGVGDMIWTSVICVAAVGLLAGGVAGVRAAVTDPLADAGEPIDSHSSRNPNLPDPTPSWSPSPSDFLHDVELELNIRYDVERQTLMAAGEYRPMTTKCDVAAHRCVVTFGSVEVTWTIEVIYPTPNLYEYRLKTDALAVTRQSVHRALVSDHPGARILRCDPLPDVFLAPVAKPYGKHCYVAQERFEDTRRVDILASRGGPYTRYTE